MGTLSLLMHYLAPPILNKSDILTGLRSVKCVTQRLRCPEVRWDLPPAREECFGERWDTSACPGFISMASCEGEKVRSEVMVALKSESHSRVWRNEQMDSPEYY